MSSNSAVKTSSARYAPTLSVQTDKPCDALNLDAIPFNVPSLCIPRVFANISKERVEAVFRKLDIGHLERIDMIERTDDKGQTWKRVFVHLHWNDSELSRSARSRLLCGNDVKIVYEDPWFWKVSANRSTRNTEQKPRTGIDVHFIDNRRGINRKPKRRAVTQQRDPSEDMSEKEYRPRSPSNSPPRDASHHIEV